MALYTKLFELYTESFGKALKAFVQGSAWSNLLFRKVIVELVWKRLHRGYLRGGRSSYEAFSDESTWEVVRIWL